jgi:hypothetical protein
MSEHPADRSVTIRATFVLEVRMLLLVVVLSWLVLGCLALAAWFVIVAAGIVLKLVACALIVFGVLAVWRQIRARSRTAPLRQARVR